MGITIESKRESFDLGFGGFGRFRKEVAKQVGEAFGAHYRKLSDPEIMFLYGKEREDYFKIYDAKTTEFIDKGDVSIEVANFLYQSDGEGKINRKQAKMIYELIKDCDDGLSYGYSGKDNCAKMSDMKKLFNDNTKVEWR